MTAIQERNQDATVYCGNVDDKVSESLLWELFLQAGPVVNVHMPKDRITQNHQGYGFIEFMTEEDADYAIKIMNMIKIYGKPIRVNKASAHNKNLDVGANIFIGNLDPDIDEKLLYDTFSAFGVILQTPKIMRDPETGNSKGYAFINFASFEASDAAIDAMNGQYLSNRPISVSYSFKKDAKGERHGSAAERLLAANNPLTQTDRPHQLFADAPPSIPMNVGADVIGGPPVLPPPIVPPPMGVVPPIGMPTMPTPNFDNFESEQHMGPPPQFPPGLPPNFMSAPPPLPGMPAFHRMNFPTNVPPPGFPPSMPVSSGQSENHQPPPPMLSSSVPTSMSDSGGNFDDNIQMNNQLPLPVPPPMTSDAPILPPPPGGPMPPQGSHRMPPPRPPFGIMGFANRGQWGPPPGGPGGPGGPPRGMMGPPPHGPPPRGMMGPPPPRGMSFDPRDMPPPRPPPMPMPRPPPMSQ